VISMGSALKNQWKYTYVWYRSNSSSWVIYSRL